MSTSWGNDPGPGGPGDAARPRHRPGTAPGARATGGGSLPPAQMAVQFGRSGGAGRLRRRLVETWVVVMALDALVAWGAWSLPVVLAVVLLALTALVAVVVTTVIGLIVAVVSRASVAAGEGWVGYRVLGRWKVVRRVLPDAPGFWPPSGPGWPGAPGGWSNGAGGGPPGDDEGAGPAGPPPELGPGA